MTGAMDAAARPKRYISERGPFEIVANPPMSTGYTWEGVDVHEAVKNWEIGRLAEKYGETAVRNKLAEMLEALAGGMVITGIFCQGDRHPETMRQLNPTGMSLSHTWIGPHFPLFSHSHPAHGDCLYLVVAGELVMGRRRLQAGSVFFLPNGHPYKYSGGPEGAEYLEIRAGPGTEGAPGMVIHEHSLESIQRIIDQANAHRHEWHAPKEIGGTALRQVERLLGLETQRVG
jgi:hypothetical protein